eukprot:m.218194 g.218194  ORF g.218194 m.218194 type:complete len:431 (+) comp33259_c1_seq1:438-1730(+)
MESAPAKNGVRRCFTVLMACSLLSWCTGPGHTTGIMNFVDLFITDLDLSRTSMGSIWFIAMAFSSFLIPFAGYFLDKPHGAQRLTKVSAIMFGGALFGLGCVRNKFVLVVLLAILRLSGPESMILIASTTINRWFTKRRGMANGIKSVFENLITMMPIITNYLITLYGWRATYCAVSIPLGLLAFGCGMLITNAPEDEGLLPDGVVPGQLKSGITAEEAVGSHKDDDVVAHDDNDDDWTFEEAVRTPFFWMINGSHMMYCVWWAGLNFNAVDFFSQRGLTATDVGELMLPLTFGISVCSLAAGIIADMIDNKVKLLGITYMSAGLVMLMGLAVRSYTTAFVFYILYGAVSGIMTCLMNLIFVELFGRKSLGKMTALVTGTWTFMSGCGPLIFGASKDLFGNYDHLGFGLACMVTLSGCFFFFTPKPTKSS